MEKFEDVIEIRRDELKDILKYARKVYEGSSKAEAIIGKIEETLLSSNKSIKDKSYKGMKREEVVRDLLLEIGIPMNLKGFKYITDAVIMCIEYEERNKRISYTKELYPMVAKKYNESSNSVERAIRHAIGASTRNLYKRERENIYNELFKNSISENDIPTNSQFLCTIANYVKNIKI